MIPQVPTRFTLAEQAPHESSEHFALRLNLLPKPQDPGFSSIAMMYRWIRINFSKTWKTKRYSPFNWYPSGEMGFDYTDLYHQRILFDLGAHVAMRSFEKYSIDSFCPNGKVLLCALTTNLLLAAPYELLQDVSTWLEKQFKISKSKHQHVLAKFLKIFQFVIKMFSFILLLPSYCIYFPFFILDFLVKEKDDKNKATEAFQRKYRSKYLGAAIALLLPLYCLTRPIVEIIKMLLSSLFGLMMIATSTLITYLILHSSTSSVLNLTNLHVYWPVVLGSILGVVLFSLLKKHYEAQQKLTNAELKEVLLKNFETLLSYTNTGVENILCVDHYHYFLAKIKTSIHKLKLDTTDLHHGQVVSHLQALSKKIPSSILPDNFDEALTNHQDLEHEILAIKCRDTTVKAAKFYTQKLRENLSVLQTSSGKIHVRVNNIFQTNLRELLDEINLPDFWLSDQPKLTEEVEHIHSNLADLYANTKLLKQTIRIFFLQVFSLVEPRLPAPLSALYQEIKDYKRQDYSRQDYNDKIVPVLKAYLSFRTPNIQDEPHHNCDALLNQSLIIIANEILACLPTDPLPNRTQLTNAVLAYKHISEEEPTNVDRINEAAQTVAQALSRSGTHEDTWLKNVQWPSVSTMLNGAIKPTKQVSDKQADAMKQIRSILFPQLTALAIEPDRFNKLLEYTMIQAFNHDNFQIHNQTSASSEPCQPKMPKQQQSHHNIPSIVLGLVVLSLGTSTTYVMIQHGLIGPEVFQIFLSPSIWTTALSYVSVCLGVMLLTLLCCWLANKIQPTSLPSFNHVAVPKEAENLLTEMRANHICSQQENIKDPKALGLQNPNRSGAFNK